MEYNIDIEKLRQRYSAVLFSCAAEANAFMDYMVKTHPSIARLFEHHLDFGYNEGYKCATLFGHGSNNPDTMTRSTIGGFNNRGFTIIPFAEILVDPEIIESDVDLDALL